MRDLTMNVIITKTDTTVEVDFAKLNDELYVHVMHKGIDNILNDANANATKKGGATDDAINALSFKALDALYAGTFKFKETTGGRVGDPVKAEAIEIAIDMTVRGEFKKAGKPLEAKAMRARAVELVGRNPAYLHLAQGRFDKRAEEAAFIAASLADDALMAELNPQPTDLNIDTMLTRAESEAK